MNIKNGVFNATKHNDTPVFRNIGRLGACYDE